MFIQVENTPNPNALKFILSVNLNLNESYNFKLGEDCKISPLVELLFDIDGLENIFLADQFISITKLVNYEWQSLQPIIITTLSDYLSAGNPIILKRYVIEESENVDSLENTSMEYIIKQIKELIETRVRPAVAQDGGDIMFHDFVDGVVYLKLYGACSGCPSSLMTLKSGVENMLKYYVPEVKSVEQVTF